MVTENAPRVLGFEVLFLLTMVIENGYLILHPTPEISTFRSKHGPDTSLAQEM